MRWNIIVECVGEEGKRSTITLGTIERVAGRTTAENLGVNQSTWGCDSNWTKTTLVRRKRGWSCQIFQATELSVDLSEIEVASIKLAA
jgi:hypothetical protein